MWNRLKQKVLDLFRDEVDEQQDNVIGTSSQSDEVHTKMLYQYPKKDSFPFPVIPDEPKSNQTMDKHVVKRTAFKNNDKEIPSTFSTPQEKKNDIENIPAYLRREKQQTQQANEEKKIKKDVNAQEKEADDGASIINHVIQTNAARQRIFERKMRRMQANIDQQEIKEEKPVPFELTNILENRRERKPSFQEKNEVPNMKRIKNIDTEKHEKQMKREQQKELETKLIQTEENENKEKSNQQKHSKVTTFFPTQVNEYNLPSDLLNEPAQINKEDQLWVKEKQRLLERTLKYFNVRATVVNTTTGPSVTRFEVQPELGVKVSKIKNLSDDIKLNMAAKDIRIEAPIPGKHTIGIEVPNPKPQMVGLKEILVSDAFLRSKSFLSIALGVTIEGDPLVTDIAKMPHGLIAGATGSGKSVCINTILISLLYKVHPADVKFLLIDPKMVELAPYNGIPHLVAPVITDAKAATQALKWAVKEMEQRYERFVELGVRDIDRFNQKVTDTAEKMPYLVIVIDELADLMMVSPQDVEEAICRIAQKARACGIHLLLATQRPSVDVITGLIKSNIPTRIAFSVSSQVDSRTILDTNGAEKLLGKGDMLFIENGSGKNVRLQGPFVSDEEIERITDYLRNLSTPNYLFEQDELLKDVSLDESEDELFQAVINFLKEQEHVSTSLLQRHFRIGYNRAARLIDDLENKGIISAQNGTKPREILLSKTQIEEAIL